MKSAGLILMLFLTAAAAAQTNVRQTACRQPIRLFSDNTTVNLTPLFAWWQQQPLVSKTGTNLDATADTGETRPLSAWQRITGTKAGAVGASWVVNATIYTSPTLRTNARIFLNHPPAAEEQTFYALKAGLVQAEQLITNAQQAYQADTKAAQRDERRAQAYRRSPTKVARDGYDYYTRLANQKRAAATTARNQQKQLEAARSQMEKQLAAIPAVNGRYAIDLFALNVGTNKHGVPVYDMGVVPANSPERGP